MGRHNRRERWFDLGAAALQWVGATLPVNTYACPQCLEPFDRSALSDGRLTVEDVPPVKVGGRPMVLTCQPCNNGAGSQLDESAGEWHRMRGLLNQPGRATPVQFAEGVNGILSIADDQTVILGVDPTRSHPGRYLTYIAEHEDRVKTSNLDPTAGLALFDFNVSFRVDKRRLRLSYLRAAYLAMFARWGYRLIISEVFEPVRRQLADPDAEIIRPIPVGLIEPLAAESSPKGYAGTLDGLGDTVVVIVNGLLCLLPGNRVDVTWWDRLADLENPDLETFVGSEWAWPTEPEHRWDH